MLSIKAKFALIAYIAYSVGRNNKLGKKALQKLVHLISELSDVDFGYKFRLYTYGPFSRELAADVDIMDTMDLVSVNFNPNRNGYEISAKDGTELIFSDFFRDHEKEKAKIDFVLSKFGDRLAKDLELSSMITFILKNKLVGDINDDDAVVEKFLEIKPHYDEVSVRKGLNEIRSLLN